MVSYDETIEQRIRRKLLAKAEALLDDEATPPSGIEVARKILNDHGIKMDPNLMPPSDRTPLSEGLPFPSKEDPD